MDWEPSDHTRIRSLVTQVFTPRRFEHADELDLTRNDNPLLTFGLGTHYCLGAPLARLELQILFKILFQRLSRPQLAGVPEYNKGFVIRGLAKLPIGY